MTESDKEKVWYEFFKEFSDNGFDFPEDNKNFLEMIIVDNGRFPYNYKSVKIEE